jgi:excinuclease ABC subunit C
MPQSPNAPQTLDPLIGVEALRAALKTIPNAPGCYKMIDGTDRILYVGKAKNLINRVTSYTNINNLNNRILRMVNQIARVEILVAKNEAEAFLIEASLIKKHQPRYNVLLKDDKSFPYIRVDTTHPFPRIEKHRGAQNKAGEYFGPFANVLALNQAMALLQKIFLLRPCADSIFSNRSRPCLQYQIKRCTAPCVGYVSEAQYKEQIDRARAFLKGKSREVQEALTLEMNEASAAMDYEKAALLRDRIRALTTVQQEQGLRVAGLNDADVIALARRGDKSAVQVFFYRNGAPFGNQAFYPRHAADASDAEVLMGFLGQFYQAHLPPEEILVYEGGLAPPQSPDGHIELEPLQEATLAQELATLSQALSDRAERKVQVRVPERGDKRALVEQAAKNAEGALARLEMERASVESHLLKLKELFGLPHMPRRIEVYDNSHISGTNAIGAFIVATPEGFDKKSYRTFNIKDAVTEPGDDYAMMREVMKRRFKQLKEGGLTPPSSPAATTPAARGSAEPTHALSHENSSLPDLILIDGGLGQLHAVEEALASIGVAGLNLVAIAKGVDRNAGREWFHIPNREPFQLPVNDPTLHYLQRLRDEAHRFAIGRHRNKRSKSFTQSALDDIPSIGPTRKKALLQHFGSRADVETATLEELQKVKGINRATAQAIYDYFHG